MGRLFGTDGVRGLANHDLTASLALKLGQSAGRILTRGSKMSSTRAIVGRDTRVSGDFLSAAVCAGLASTGVDVRDVGILPTPGIAFLTSSLGIDLGVVISASHNAMPDNGIKFFSHSGFKLDDAAEDEIERELDNNDWVHPTGKSVGWITYDHETAQSAYIQHLVDAVSEPFVDLHVVLDAANGAASKVALQAFTQSGAQVTIINAAPDGYNINENCGSTHPEELQATVKAEQADFGVAFDGDADRCIAVDENGEIVDGDKIIAILALEMKRAGTLKNNKVALTVMSNLGIRNALLDADIEIETTGVGDRYVLEQMIKHDLVLGGEQSGHIVNLNYSTTGDGVLSALLLANTLQLQRREQNRAVPLSELTKNLKLFPQVLINVSGVNQAALESDVQLQQFAKELEDELGSDGRILLRASGTEPLVRVMVEASSQKVAEAAAELLATKVRERLSL
jgi:phosphoglucosamine mutase